MKTGKSIKNKRIFLPSERDQWEKINCGWRKEAQTFINVFVSEVRFFALPTYLLPKCDFKTIFKNSLSFLRQPLITNYNVNQCIHESFGAFGLRRCYFYIVKRVKTRTQQVGIWCNVNTYFVEDISGETYILLLAPPHCYEITNEIPMRKQILS